MPAQEVNMNMQCETVTLERAEQLTGLPSSLIETLANCGRIPAEKGADEQLYIGKVALLAWCKLYARILGHVARQHRPDHGGYNVFELVWMSRNGLLEGQRRHV